MYFEASVAVKKKNKPTKPNYQTNHPKFQDNLSTRAPFTLAIEEEVVVQNR